MMQIFAKAMFRKQLLTWNHQRPWSNVTIEQVAQDTSSQKTNQGHLRFSETTTTPIRSFNFSFFLPSSVVSIVAEDWEKERRCSHGSHLLLVSSGPPRVTPLYPPFLLPPPNYQPPTPPLPPNPRKPSPDSELVWQRNRRPYRISSTSNRGILIPSRWGRRRSRFLNRNGWGNRFPEEKSTCRLKRSLGSWSFTLSARKLDVPIWGSAGPAVRRGLPLLLLWFSVILVPGDAGALIYSF